MTCYPGSGAHVFSTYATSTAVDPATMQFGRCDCGMLTYEQAVEHVAAQRADATAETESEVSRLHAVIAKAVADLDAEHSPLPADQCGPRGGCVTCWPKDGSCPCTTRMVADELREALQ